MMTMTWTAKLKAPSTSLSSRQARARFLRCVDPASPLHLAKNVNNKPNPSPPLFFFQRLHASQKYVSYARTHVSPRLTEKAATSLANRYVKMRSDVRQAQLESEAGSFV